MSNTDDIDDTILRSIRDTARAQPIGDERGVRCTDCGDHITDGEEVRAYVIGNEDGTQWQVSKVMHPDCGRLFSPERIEQNDDTDALVRATLVHDPSVSAGGPDETQVAKSENASVITAPRGVYRLENPEVEAVSMMSEERREARQEMMENAEEMMEKIQSGDMDGHPLSEMLGGDGPGEDTEK